MPKAVLRNGVICPLEPLPPEWGDGRELVVEDAADDDDQGFDAWMKELESLIAVNDPAELSRIEKSLKAADEQAKALVRKEMGLP
jgi:hypothetical protein